MANGSHVAKIFTYFLQRVEYRGEDPGSLHLNHHNVQSCTNTLTHDRFKF